MFQEDCLVAQDEASHHFHFSWLIILCAFVGWKEPAPHTQFRQLVSGEIRGVRYTNLWETSNPEKKKLNAIVFYEYYALLRKVVQETPWISKEVVDTYDDWLNFMVDRQRIHIRPKRTKRDD